MCFNYPSSGKLFKLTLLSQLHHTTTTLIDRTLSNWVYEFDKWAPTVVKVSYKVSFGSHTTSLNVSYFLHMNTKSVSLNSLVNCTVAFACIIKCCG